MHSAPSCRQSRQRVTYAKGTEETWNPCTLSTSGNGSTPTARCCKPPVGNKRVFADGDFIIMVVGGPNARKDYHVDPGQEFFYQLEGDMVLKTMQDGRAVDLPIREGEMLLLPAARAALAAAPRQHGRAGHRARAAAR